MVGSYSGPYGQKRPACQIQVWGGGGGSSGMGLLRKHKHVGSQHGGF